MIIDALITGLVLFIASITIAVHHGRQHPHGAHREPDPAAERRSMEKLRGHVAARVADSRPAPPAATLALPAYSQTVPRRQAAGRPPWPVQPTRTEGGRPWQPRGANAPTAPSASATAPTCAISAATTAPASRTRPAPHSSAWVRPIKITACAVCGRQSHGTANHDQWAALSAVALMLKQPPAADPPDEFRLPAWDVTPPPGLPGYAEAALKHATVDEAVESIFMPKVSAP